MKGCLMVIMTILLARNVEKFELQRESSQRDLKIRSNYRSFRITKIYLNYGKEIIRVFSGNFTVTLNLLELWRFELERVNCMSVL